MRRILLSAVISFAMPVSVYAQDIPLSKILVEKENWREVAKGLPAVSFLEPERTGSIVVYNVDPKARLHIDGKMTKLTPTPGEDERRTQRTVHWYKGAAWIDWGGFTIAGMKERYKFANGPASCLALWPDEGHLVIGSEHGAYLWAVRIEKDGSFGPGDRYYSLRTKPNVKMHVTAMTMDAGYLLYACTPIGIQVFDPTGRLSGVIEAPSKDTMTAITIGGAKADELFVAAGNKIYARKIQGKAPYTLKKEK